MLAKALPYLSDWLSKARPKPEEGLSVSADYFRAFEDVTAPDLPAMSKRRQLAWQFCAAFTVGLGCWYLYWRWTQSLNYEALTFSVIVALAETLMFFGTLLYFFDTWEEGDRDTIPLPTDHKALKDAFGADTTVDVFITTYDEDVCVLEATLRDALAMRTPPGWDVTVHLLDDGSRESMRGLARDFGVNYISRDNNLGFKAGNLRNALLRTDGAFVVICDADTRLFPSFLENTLGYFSDESVAWVQTPHWFYDIPLGASWASRVGATASRWISLLTGRERSGGDPFLSGSMLFFDVIQRRRDRNNASFCCGAGSIHRREPLFSDGLHALKADRAAATAKQWQAKLVPMQPFRFHVSEDIYTSMMLHSAPNGAWKSVYHPKIECKMLSPWSMDAWAGQKLKYAGGSLDLMLQFRRIAAQGMPWRHKLHYLATFWSYVASAIIFVLMAAPIFTLFTGIAPVSTYSVTFFLHLVPLLLANEIALAIGAKGHNGEQGRILAIATLPITLYSFVLVVMGRRIKFKPTPKQPRFQDSLRFVWPHIACLALMIAAAVAGWLLHLGGSREHSLSLLIVNYFWLSWCGWALVKAIAAATWRPSKIDLQFGAPNMSTFHVREKHA